MAADKNKFNDGRTKLHQKDFKKKALQIRLATPKGQNWAPIVFEQIGKPYWDSDGNAVKKPSDGNAYALTSGGPNAVQVRLAKDRKETKKQSGKVRSSNLKKGSNKTNKAILEQSKNVMSELLPPGKKTFEMGGKIWDYESFPKQFAESHNQETKDAAKTNRKLQSWFKAKSSHGHSAGTGTKAHVESHWSFHPQDFYENSEDRGIVNKQKLNQIKNAEMALTPEEAARKQLPSGDDLVSDPTSGETRDRIMRGEPAEEVKAEELKRKRKKYLAKGYQDKNGDNGDNGDNGHKNGKVKIKNGDKKKPPNGKGGTPTGTGGGGDIKVTDKKIKNAALVVGKNLPGALSVPATTTNAYMMIKQALATPSKKNIALAILGGVEAGADIAGLVPMLALPAEALSQGAGKIGGGLQTMSMLKQLQMNPKINPKALLQSKRLQGAGI